MASPTPPYEAESLCIYEIYGRLIRRSESLGRLKWIDWSQVLLPMILWSPQGEAFSLDDFEVVPSSPHRDIYPVSLLAAVVSFLTLTKPIAPIFIMSHRFALYYVLFFCILGKLSSAIPYNAKSDQSSLNRRTESPYFPQQPPSCPICQQNYASINSCAEAAPVLANFSQVSIFTITESSTI